ncbi:MAG TPA: cupin domain-containing protein [Trichocoleus sp.]
MTASTVSGIQIERQPGPQRLETLGVFSWPTWSKEPSQFPWVYDEAETCYLLSGDVTVTPEGGEPVTLGQGDLVTFPAGMRCTWEIRTAVHKHYRFG